MADPRLISLETQPVTVLKGVGPQLACKLERLDVHTVQGLLFHLPYRYQDRTQVTPIGSLAAGTEALIVGQVELTELAYGRRRSLLSRISDGTGTLTMRLFHFSGTQQANLQRGRWVRCFGEVRRGPVTQEMVHPEYTVFEAKPSIVFDTSLTPIYAATAGVSQYTLRKLTDQALETCLPEVKEWIPKAIRNKFTFPSLRDALAYVHRPPVDADQSILEQGGHPMQQRLAFEELLAHHLSLRRLRERRLAHTAPPMRPAGKLLARFRDGLTFTLTRAQQRVIDELLRDLEQPTPMLRLVQGDVGSGKTVVAAAAATWAVDAGYQVAIMAPTELLAEQHFRTFSDWLEPIGVPLAWLSGKIGARQRRAVLEQLCTGETRVAVGTHALFQADVAFAELGLVIVDEQHRFGVDQRQALLKKGSNTAKTPHQLIMTATPIPRTLAMTFYADLDVSSIDELPPGRAPVETVVVPDTRRDEILQRVRGACSAGRQAYWVCPIIDESEALQVQAATDTENALKQALPELRIGLVHGRMNVANKDRVMAAFRNGDIDLLVATTVIEVGVDVPNASLMIVENVERLGLSQLHQLRGRVGRGDVNSCCVFMYRPPLSNHARVRVAALRETTDGFEIARRDLELRGPGEVLGTRQTGLQQLRIADLVRDRGLLPQVEQAATILLQHYPENVSQLIARWIGRGQDYGDV